FAKIGSEMHGYWTDARFLKPAGPKHNRLAWARYQRRIKAWVLCRSLSGASRVDIERDIYGNRFRGGQVSRTDHELPQVDKAKTRSNCTNAASARITKLIYYTCHGLVPVDWVLSEISTAMALGHILSSRPEIPQVDRTETQPDRANTASERITNS